MRLVITLDSHGRRDVDLVDDTGRTSPLAVPEEIGWERWPMDKMATAMMPDLEHVAHAATSEEKLILIGNPRLYDSWHHRDDPQEPRTLCVVWMVS
jgi:hypothetical protein